jgi:hypothetical protein
MPLRLRSKAGMVEARGLDEGRAPTIAISDDDPKLPFSRLIK